MRKHHWDTYCGATDSKSIYIAPSRVARQDEDVEEGMGAIIDEYPSRPGCFMYLPTGCPNHPMKSKHPRHDAWVQLWFNDTETECKTQQDYWDVYCGTTDAKAMHIAPNSVAR